MRFGVEKKKKSPDQDLIRWKLYFWQIFRRP
jgi:hypothetical protein